MPIPIWSDEYSINVAEIDEQHKRLLELVGELHVAVEARIDKDELRKMLANLAKFTCHHFDTEERLMKEHKFERMKKHHKEHKVLKKHLEQLVNAVSKGKYPTFYSDYDVSNDWFLNHVLKFDKKLGEYLNAKGVF